ncbi:MAG: SpoIID/LytB domain-containing protein [Sedimentisphaerales bacterium]|nr:SpoIID/LytB domain-containing protein [Sedimentisphaerales bacterium]
MLGRTVARHPRIPLFRHSSVPWVRACIVLLAALLGGCEQREIVRPTPQMGIESRFWVRVLLLSNATECTLKAPAALRAGRPTLGPEISVAQAVLPPNVPAKVTLGGGQFVFGNTPIAGTRFLVSAEKPYVFTLNGRDYRGKLELAANNDGRTFTAINLVPLEPYLAGVVGAEMPDYWEPEALKAQTIAARTYCLYIKNRFGANRTWDVSSTQASQVYGGISAESTPIWNAVNATYGMVLTTGGQPGSASGLFPAYYSAICGGHTESSERVFGDTFAPLSGVACPYCKEVARLGLYFWPMAQFDRDTVTRRLIGKYPSLKALGEIREIIVEDKSDYGASSRLTRVRLVGSTGKTDTLRGEDLRLTLDPSGRKLQSTICQVVPWGNGWAFLSGRGWGHGVGMCQYGAEGLARLGKNAREILRYYYPGAQIVNVY